MRHLAVALAGGAALAAVAACATVPARHASPGATPSVEDIALLDTLERRTFDYFWDLSDPRTGTTPDRWPTRSFVSVGATGFALTAYPIGVERGYVTRAQAGERTRNTLRFFWTAPQGPEARGMTGYKGFFYHFLEPATGHRFETVELSTVDTALFFAGALFCQSYFDRRDPVEEEIRALTDSIYARIDWAWAVHHPPMIALGWTPERGFLPYDWRGYNEAMLLHVLALGSPSHPVTADTWRAWLSGYQWGTYYGYAHVGFAPLFGHQYSHMWLDLRGLRDEYMAQRGIDYVENARRATLAQRAYAIANPRGFRGYDAETWGLTACDGPLDTTITHNGRSIEMHTYWGRGASFTHENDDGTICPSAAAASIAFAPEVVLPTLRRMRDRYGEALFSRYGFVDAFNPTLTAPVRTHHGRVVPGVGWFDTDYLGIDQGPILIMLENYRSELVWKTMRRNPHLVRGLKAAGFRGGWLDEAGESK
jgi:hypothetical protein